MLKRIFIITITACALLSLYNNYCVIPDLEMQVKDLSTKAKELEVKQDITSAELALKTHPEYVDMSLRTWFEQQLRDDREQVRGIDGKFTRER